MVVIRQEMFRFNLMYIFPTAVLRDINCAALYDGPNYACREFSPSDLVWRLGVRGIYTLLNDGHQVYAVLWCQHASLLWLLDRLYAPKQIPGYLVTWSPKSHHKKLAEYKAKATN